MTYNSLTPVEEKLMLTLWTLDSVLMRDIMQALPDPKPHQNTVSTYLKILVEKGYLKAEKEGRFFRYSPVISYVQYKKFLVDEIILVHFNNESSELLSFLKDHKIISSEENKPSEEAANESSSTELPSALEKEIKLYVKELTRNIGEKKESKKKSSKKKKKKK